MKLISISDYQLKIADEALLVKPFRKLWNQDRSQSKEQFYKQMSILYFVYSPSSNYSYIIDEKERMKEVLLQEGIEDFRPSNPLAHWVVAREGKWLKRKLATLKNGGYIGTEYAAFLPCRKLKYRGIIFVSVDFYNN